MAGVTSAAEAESSRAEEIRRVKAERHEMSSDEGMEDGSNARNNQLKRKAQDDAEGSGSEQWEEEGDVGDSALDGVDFEDDSANVDAYMRMQNAQKRRKTFGSSCDAGAVKRITLVNFMNHRHFTTDFGPKMNFLVGHNGSGKSAILSALAVALGGKAAATGRASGFKELIRKGCDKAQIILILNNSGYSAFKPDVYPSEIVIERTLLLSGASTYKFRASLDGKILASKRDELHQITEHFDINVDSPLTVLTQDAARTFLQKSTKKSLYRFFMEGTGLNTLADAYEKMMGIRKRIEFIAEGQESALSALKAKADELFQKVTHSEKYVEYKAEQARMRRTLAWALVRDKESECRAAEEKRNATANKVTDAKANVENIEEDLKNLEAIVIQLKNEHSAFTRSRSSLQSEERKAKLGLKTAQASLQAQLDEIRDFKENHERKKADLHDIKKKIENLKATSMDQEDPKQAELRKEIQELENLLAKIRKDLPIRDERVRAEEAKKADIVQRIADLDAERNSEVDKINQAERMLANLDRQSTNRLSAFGTNIDRVMNAIDKAKWKHSKPLGPLGRHVHLEDLSLRHVMSSHLGQFLCGFAVRCNEDRIQLARILKRCVQFEGYLPGTGVKAAPLILQHTGDLFDFSNGDLRRYGPTILSRLRIDNEEVLRVLIVQRSIEKMFISDNAASANRLLDDLIAKGISGATVLTNEEFGFNISGDRNTRGTRMTSRWTGNSLFLKDVDAEIQDHKQKRDEARNRRDQIIKQIEELSAARNAVTFAVGDVVRGINKMRTDMSRIQTQISTLKSKLEEGQKETDIDACEDLRRTIQKDLIDIEEEIGAAERALPGLEQNLDAFKDEISKLNRQLENFGQTADEKMKAVSDAVENLETKRTEVRHYKSSLNRYETDLGRLNGEVTRMEATVADWSKQAASLGPRTTSDRTCAQLQAELDKITEVVKRGEKTGLGNQQELQFRYKAAQDQYKARRDEVQRLRKFAAILGRALNIRMHWWTQVRGQSAVRTSVLFLVNCQKRGLEGRLVFNHEYEELIIDASGQMTSREGEEQTQVRVVRKGPKNQSGGERSFSTVSLLLAMWNVANSRIRCLDEWDVFLDMVNRGIAAGMLIQGALESEEKQYILITPQDMSGIKLDHKDIKVIKLSDPERGQGTLSFAPV